MNEYDYQYKNILKKILDRNCKSNDRTGVGTIKIPSATLRVDLQDYSSDKKILPILSLRKIYPRVVFEELKWMLSGSTDANVLKDKNIHIWDGNTTREFLDGRGLTHLREGHIGKGYGKQFRDFSGVDQFQAVIDTLLHNPESRRNLISLWNVGELHEMALPPCHLLYQFVTTGDVLNLSFYQRSSDFVLAGSHNFVFASFFLHLVCDITGMVPGEICHHIADCHIYKNHISVAEELIERNGKDRFAEFEWNSEDFVGCDVASWAVDSMKWESVSIDYDSDPAIDKSRLNMAT